MRALLVRTDEEVPRELRFEAPFRIGRTDECEVCIRDQFVSRAHLAVVVENGQWLVRDLNSSNGIFVAGQRVREARIERSLAVRLGIEGPFVRFEVEPMPPAAEKDAAVAHLMKHYFGESGAESAGEHTILIRRAYRQVQKKQKRRYGWVMASLAVLAVAAGAYALYLHLQVRRQKLLAQDIFYSMKSVDVDIASVESLVQDSGGQRGMEEIRKLHRRRKEMETNYDEFLAGLHVYSAKMTEPQRLILRVTRVFGECELAMPPGFEREIENYIGKWKSSGRYARDIRRANQQGYTGRIVAELLAQDLPPQFFYLALQESDFDPYISGPMTRKGIAKGMWQFIPETGVKYGLRIGPLADLPRPDPGDDRHHWELETRAAARYLKDLYSADAQASGLLAMACYNWGEDQVLPMVQKLPGNPKDRNFWRLLARYPEKIPRETYDYVYYIVSAAVIGENPRFFGFDFDNPLYAK